jgi:CheY-like chemotaxis protein
MRFLPFLPLFQKVNFRISKKCIFARAAAKPPDFIVLDIMMPKVVGIEVCRCIRANQVAVRHGPRSVRSNQRSAQDGHQDTILVRPDIPELEAGGHIWAVSLPAGYVGGQG